MIVCQGDAAALRGASGAPAVPGCSALGLILSPILLDAATAVPQLHGPKFPAGPMEVWMGCCDNGGTPVPGARWRSAVQCP